MQKKHFFIILCLVALCLTPVFAEGSKDQAATITMWTGYSETLPVLNAAAADYSKEHPNVKFEISGFTLREQEQKLVVAMSAGAAPDLSDLGAALAQRSGAQGFLVDQARTDEQACKHNEHARDKDRSGESAHGLVRLLFVVYAGRVAMISAAHRPPAWGRRWRRSRWMSFLAW